MLHQIWCKQQQLKMQITIDTQKDSKEDIKKAISLLNSLAEGHTNQGNIFESSGGLDLPKTNESAPNANAFGAMFGSESIAEPSSASPQSVQANPEPASPATNPEPPGVGMMNIFADSTPKSETPAADDSPMVDSEEFKEEAEKVDPDVKVEMY